MNRRTTLILASVAPLCLAVTLPAGDAMAQQKSLKEQLLGTWTLVSSETTAKSGAKRHNDQQQQRPDRMYYLNSHQN